MAEFLKEFTHVIAIDFGTGESGYTIVANIQILIQMCYRSI